MNEEIWKAIPHYEGIYEVSTYGRIRTTIGKTTYTKRHGVRHWKQRILKPKGETYKTGYRVSLWKNGVKKDWLVARLVGITFLGESDLTINHIDGNRFNNHIENLEWCTLAENIRKGFETNLYTNQIKIKVIDKKENKEYTFRNLTIASKFINKNKGYISNSMKRKIFENEDFRWELI